MGIPRVKQKQPPHLTNVSDFYEFPSHIDLQEYLFNVMLDASPEHQGLKS